jgi:hypothetical protein
MFLSFPLVLLTGTIGEQAHKCKAVELNITDILDEVENREESPILSPPFILLRILLISARLPIWDTCYQNRNRQSGIA